MRNMEEARQKYDSITIPDELSKRVMMEIEKAGKLHQRKVVKIRRNLIFKRTAAVAASLAVLFTVGVNSSEAFAKEAARIPVIGSIARVVTFRSYEEKTETAGIAVDIPGIGLISEKLGGLEKEVNEEIYSFCKEYAEQAVEKAEEYREAFLETGGTEEEWAEHDIRIKVWYEVKSQTDSYLSLAVMGNDNWNNADYESKYYNLNLKTGNIIKFEDLYDSLDIQFAEENVRRQIRKREKETGMEFWGDEWQGIDENTRFYINSAGNPVIVFEKYEIAPGAAGVQEFEITVT